MKFGAQPQNYIPMTKEWSKSTPKVKIKYDGRLFSKPEVVLTQPKIDGYGPNLVRREPSAYTIELFHQTRNRKLICGAVAAILKTAYDVITRPAVVRFG